jgi:hypothetical protein
MKPRSDNISHLVDAVAYPGKVHRHISDPPVGAADDDLLGRQGVDAPEDRRRTVNTVRHDRDFVARL